MSKFRHTDILLEMIELCQERMTELRQQLGYYRASVYKAEMSGQIASNIERLRMVAEIFGDVMVQEAFKDYEAMASMGIAGYIPGECSLSQRVTSLLASLETQLARLQFAIASRALPLSQEDLQSAVEKKRDQLLALCRHGSRQWAFFQSL